MKGFSLGADDYLVKPFLLSVLQAHIEAVLRRVKGANRKKVYGQLTIDERAHKIYLNGDLLSLTPREYMVLQYFIYNIWSGVPF